MAPTEGVIDPAITAGHLKHNNGVPKAHRCYMSAPPGVQVILTWTLRGHAVHMLRVAVIRYTPLFFTSSNSDASFYSPHEPEPNFLGVVCVFCVPWTDGKQRIAGHTFGGDCYDRCQRYMAMQAALCLARSAKCTAPGLLRTHLRELVFVIVWHWLGKPPR